MKSDTRTTNPASETKPAELTERQLDKAASGSSMGFLSGRPAIIDGTHLSVQSNKALNFTAPAN